MLIFLACLVRRSTLIFASGTPSTLPILWDQTLTQARVEPAPDIAIAYNPPRNPALDTDFQRLNEQQILERLAVRLSPLRAAENLKIRMDECGALTRVLRHGRRNP